MLGVSRAKHKISNKLLKNIADFSKATNGSALTFKNGYMLLLGEMVEAYALALRSDSIFVAIRQTSNPVKFLINSLDPTSS